MVAGEVQLAVLLALQLALQHALQAQALGQPKSCLVAAGEAAAAVAPG